MGGGQRGWASASASLTCRLWSAYATRKGAPGGREAIVPAIRLCGQRHATGRLWCECIGPWYRGRGGREAHHATERPRRGGLEGREAGAFRPARPREDWAASGSTEKARGDSGAGDGERAGGVVIEMLHTESLRGRHTGDQARRRSCAGRVCGGARSGANEQYSGER